MAGTLLDTHRQSSVSCTVGGEDAASAFLGTRLAVMLGKQDYQFIHLQGVPCSRVGAMRLGPGFLGVAQAQAGGAMQQATLQ